MKAAVYHGKGDLRLETVVDPVAGPGEVLVEIAANGICGTDLHLLAHGPETAGVRPPFVLGHEFAGAVLDVGEGVDDLQIGSIVAVEPMLPCGRCRHCSQGAPNICRSIRWYGLGETAGGLAEMAVVARSSLHAVPAGLGAQEASLAEPLAVAMHAVNRSGLVAGQRAVVIGCGPIGIAVALCLMARGIEKVAAVEKSAIRRAAVSALGLDCVLSPGPGCADALRTWSRGEGCDAAFDTAGVPAAFDTALQAAARGGAVVLVALHTGEVGLDLRRLLFSEKRLIPSIAYAGTFPEVLDLMAAGRINLDPWVRTIRLSEIGPGVERLFRQEAIKLLVDPRA